MASRVGTDTPSGQHFAEQPATARSRSTVPKETNPQSGLLRAPSAPPPLKPGFRARLSGATLSDLIQFECQERSRKIVRVSSDKGCGFLYFRDGNLVHAVEGMTSGEPAVRTLLRWASGTFEAWQGPWPREESIALTWQNLLLRAAQAEDEEQRKPKVVSLRKDASMDTPMVVEHAEDDAEPMLVQLSSSGESVLGNAPPEFGEGAAYAATIADVLGELMGIERMHAIEYTLHRGACVIARDPRGNLTAVSGRGYDVASLKSLISR